MTAADLVVAHDDLALMNSLLASEDLWIERAAEADVLADGIMNSPSTIVVLLGPPRAGKTELLRRWIIPRLSWQSTVHYRDSCEDSPDNTRAADIEVWDGFEQCLTDDGISSGAVAARLSSLIAARRKVVLCVGDDALSRLFQLTSAAPQLRGDVLQIPLVSGERVVRTLQQTALGQGIRLSDSFMAAVAADLNAMPPTATIGMELVAILVVQLRRNFQGKDEIAKEDYLTAGGMNGLLEAHLDFLFERLPEGIDGQITWAVMQEIVTTVHRTELDLDDVGRRFAVSGTIPWRVVQWLE